MTKKVFNSPLHGAEFLASLGFPVFPLARNSKVPLVKSWNSSNNTTSPTKETFRTPSGEQIQNNEVNWGVFCRHLFVVDIDAKNNDDGFTNWTDLCKHLNIDPFPETLTVWTPSGGCHIYFRCQDDHLKSTAGALGQYIDTRTNNGYVVCPGSQINGKTYQIEGPTEILQIPPALHKKARSCRTKQLDDQLIPESGVLPEGERHERVKHVLIQLRELGFPPDLLQKTGMELLGYCANSFSPEDNVTEDEVKKLVKWVTEHISAIDLDGLMLLDDSQGEPSIEFASALQDFSDQKLPPRRFYMERRLSPQNVSTIVACGGTGKSQLLSLDAVSIATGRPLSGFEIDEPRRVWMHNTEDDITEMRRKIAAIQQHFRIDGREIHDQIFLSSARSTKFTIVEENQNGALLQAQTCDQIIKFIRKHKIAVWMIDPFVRVHAVDENKNKHMDAVMEALLTIMLHTDCAILVSHHTNKSVFNVDDLNMGLSRGASAVTDAARFSHVLRNMTEKETKRFYDVSLDDRHAYVRLERVKSNLFFSPDRTNWFKRVSVTLENGDEVGILDPVCLSLAQEEEDHCRFILERHATRNVEADFGPLFQACLNDENLPDDLAELKPQALKERLRRWIKKQPDWQFTQTKNCVHSKYVWKSQ